MQFLALASASSAMRQAPHRHSGQSGKSEQNTLHRHISIEGGCATVE
jgi:hypothetical protein